MSANQYDGVDPRYLDSAFEQRLTVRFAAPYFGVCEEPQGLMVNVLADECGLVLATTEEYDRAVIALDRRPPVVLFAPWRILSVTGSRRVPPEVLPEAFR